MPINNTTNTASNKQDKYKEFVKFLANRHMDDGLSKAQIIRMADQLINSGEWQKDHVVRDGETALGMAHRNIYQLESKIAKLEKLLTKE